MTEKNISRRTVLKLMGAVAGAAALGTLPQLTGCHKKEQDVRSSDVQPEAPSDAKAFATKRIVLFFTGTGNCLYVAKSLSDAPVSIPQAMKKGEFEYEAEEIGIVYPIYGQMPPNMVRKFMKQAKLKCRYLFAVATYGNVKGGSVEVFQRIAGEYGLKFDYIATLLMVDNWLPMYDMSEQVKLDKKIDENLAAIKADIDTNKKYIEPVSDEEHQKAESLYQRTEGIFLPDGVHAKAEEWFTITDRCISCGICVRICPRSNYRIEVEQAVTSGECELCLACVHACPHKAIQLTKGEKNPNARFRNPNVKSSEIQRANNQHQS